MLFAKVHESISFAACNNLILYVHMHPIHILSSQVNAWYFCSKTLTIRMHLSNNIGEDYEYNIKTSLFERFSHLFKKDK